MPSERFCRTFVINYIEIGKAFFPIQAKSGSECFPNVGYALFALGSVPIGPTQPASTAFGDRRTLSRLSKGDRAQVAPTGDCASKVQFLFPEMKTKPQFLIDPAQLQQLR
jgi:hypothetical protein